MQSLARYRYLLGVVLGDGTPAWRWELWKDTPHGSVRIWTNPSNVFFASTVLMLTVGVLWFSRPAVTMSTSPLLAVFWWGATGTTGLLVLLAVGIGLRNISTNHVARPLDQETWHELARAATVVRRPPDRPTWVITIH